MPPSHRLPSLALISLASLGWAFSLVSAPPGLPLAPRRRPRHRSIGLNTSLYYLGVAVASPFIPWLMRRANRVCVVTGMLLDASSPSSPGATAPSPGTCICRGRPQLRRPDLRVRAGHARPRAPGDHRGRRGQYGRYPARYAAGDGAVPGRVLHLSRGGAVGGGAGRGCRHGGGRQPRSQAGEPARCCVTSCRSAGRV